MTLVALYLVMSAFSFTTWYVIYFMVYTYTCCLQVALWADYEDSLPSNLLWREWALHACVRWERPFSPVLPLLAIARTGFMCGSGSPASLEEPTPKHLAYCTCWRCTPSAYHPPLPYLSICTARILPPPSPRSLLAPMVLLFLNVRIMCTTDILHFTMMISCFFLHVIYWGFGIVQWWFCYWDNGIVQWWMIIWFFHDSCYLH